MSRASLAFLGCLVLGIGAATYATSYDYVRKTDATGGCLFSLILIVFGALICAWVANR